MRISKLRNRASESKEVCRVDLEYHELHKTGHPSRCMEACVLSPLHALDAAQIKASDAQDSFTLQELFSCNSLKKIA